MTPAVVRVVCSLHGDRKPIIATFKRCNRPRDPFRAFYNITTGKAVKALTALSGLTSAAGKRDDEDNVFDWGQEMVPKVTEEGKVHLGERLTGTELVEDEPLPSWQDPQPDPAMPRRVRYRFTCPLCRASVPAREERLFDILDRLADNGVSELSLQGLGARKR